MNIISATYNIMHVDLRQLHEIYVLKYMNKERDDFHAVTKCVGTRCPSEKPVMSSTVL